MCAFDRIGMTAGRRVFPGPVAIHALCEEGAGSFGSVGPLGPFQYHTAHLQ